MIIFYKGILYDTKPTDADIFMVLFLLQYVLYYFSDLSVVKNLAALSRKFIIFCFFCSSFKVTVWLHISVVMFVHLSAAPVEIHYKPNGIIWVSNGSHPGLGILLPLPLMKDKSRAIAPRISRLSVGLFGRCWSSSAISQECLVALIGEIVNIWWDGEKRRRLRWRRQWSRCTEQKSHHNTF